MEAPSGVTTPLPCSSEPPVMGSALPPSAPRRYSRSVPVREEETRMDRPSGYHALGISEVSPRVRFLGLSMWWSLSFIEARKTSILT